MPLDLQSFPGVVAVAVSLSCDRLYALQYISLVQRIRFTGAVHPTALRITIKDLPVQVWPETDAERFRIAFQVTIVDSRIDVEVTADQVFTEDDDGVGMLAGRALELSKAAIDVFCLQVGWGLTCTLDRYIDAVGVTRTLLPHLPHLPIPDGIAKGSPFTIKSGSLDWEFGLLGSNPRIASAVSDLVRAFAETSMVEINCARSLETIRHEISPMCPNKTASWMNIRHTLNLTEDYTRSITDISSSPRHGDSQAADANMRANAIDRSMVMMHRFLLLRRRGLIHLPIDEFPLLDA